MTHRNACVNGIRLHYVVNGSGPLILFLHGFPEFWYQWKAQLDEFGGDFLAVAPDMRGYNLSDKPEDIASYHISHLVEDVAGLATHLGHEQFMLAGHDWGGVVAWSVAMRYPDRIKKLVIINAPHPVLFANLLKEDPDQQMASQYMLTLRSPQAEAGLSTGNFMWLNRILFDSSKGSVFSEEDRRTYQEAWSQPGALTGGLNYYRAARVGPSTNGAGEFRNDIVIDSAADPLAVPTLVLWGEQDRALSIRNVEDLGPLVSNLTVKRFPENTHWLQHERTADVNDAIRDFISGEEASRVAAG